MTPEALVKRHFLTALKAAEHPARKHVTILTVALYRMPYHCGKGLAGRLRA